jgi:tryptophan 7-halogenase
VQPASDDRIRSIVVIGGGVAGWMAAATLARALKPGFCEIALLERPPADAGEISQSTLPSFHRLNGLLGIDEPDLMRKTGATFRLGAQFTHWARPGDRYFHTFGSIGARLAAVPFHQYWIKLRQLGEVGSIENFSIASTAAALGRFAPPVADPRSVLSHYSYAYHFHAGLLAEYLREYAQDHGAVRVARGIVEVKLRSEDGLIDALSLDDGTALRADLYIDCTGSPGGLFTQALQTSFIDWSHWLPCDRAVVIPCAALDDPPPFSQSIAGTGGWQWRVPLQQCLDSGYAYSSQFLSDDAAISTLLRDLPGGALAEPRWLAFVRGRPREFWARNYLILAGGAMEPLEATGLHLVQTGIARLLTLFPVRRCSAEDVEEYNRLTILEHERVRDFLILHYKATARRDSPLWDYCCDMPIPETLREKIELFRDSGRISLLDEEHFNEDSWLTLFLGQRIDPHGHDPLADVLDIAVVRAAFSRASSAIRAAAAALPSHRQFIDEHCGVQAKGIS